MKLNFTTKLHLDRDAALPLAHMTLGDYLDQHQTLTPAAVARLIFDLQEQAESRVADGLLAITPVEDDDDAA